MGPGSCRGSIGDYSGTSGVGGSDGSGHNGSSEILQGGCLSLCPSPKFYSLKGGQRLSPSVYGYV